MSLLRDLVITVGDALRLSNDLMRYKIDVQARSIKRGVSRLATKVVVYLTTLIIVAVGVGFLLCGAFILIARAIGSAGVAGLIVGAAILLVAGIVALVGRSL